MGNIIAGLFRFKLNPVPLLVFMVAMLLLLLLLLLLFFLPIVWSLDDPETDPSPELKEDLELAVDRSGGDSPPAAC